jgi:hypothetical protein
MKRVLVNTIIALTIAILLSIIVILIWWIFFKKKSKDNYMADIITTRNTTKFTTPPKPLLKNHTIGLLPKTVHILGVSTELSELETLKKLFKGYTVKLCSTQYCEDMLYQHYGGITVLYLRTLPPILKAVLSQLLILYIHGGFCFNVIPMLKTHFDEIIQPDTTKKFYCSIDRHMNFQNTCIGSVSGSETLWSIIVSLYQNPHHSLNTIFIPYKNIITSLSEEHFIQSKSPIANKDEKDVPNMTTINPTGSIQVFKQKPIIRIGGKLPIYSLKIILQTDNNSSQYEIYYSDNIDLPCLEALEKHYDIKLYPLNYSTLEVSDRVINLSYYDPIAPGNPPLSKSYKKLTHCPLFNQNYPGYRLGDMVRITGERKANEGETLHFTKFPNSIASEYMKRTDKEEDYEILADIVRHRSKDSLVDKDTIALHLRVGDVVNTTEKSVSNILLTRTFISENHWAYYTSNLQDIANGISAFTEIQNIIIFAGAHFDQEHSKSCQYLEAVQNYLENLGYKVEMRIGQDPDSDFLLMCNAPYFISSGGGFSRIVVETRKALGNLNSIHIQDIKIYKVRRPGTCLELQKRLQI